jgi:FG-GAP repeat
MSKARRLVMALWVLAATGIAVFGATNPSQPSASSITTVCGTLKAMKFKGDLNKDGFSDLVVGVPGDESVHVLYGSSSGVSTTDQILRPGSNGLPNVQGYFGNAVAVGDFDGNGYDDLAIGVPKYDSSMYRDVGAVVIVYSFSGGLQVSLSFTQASSGIADDAEGGDEFGSALAAGDFNRDGYADLLIGVPLEDYETCRDYVNGVCQAVLTTSDAGVVHVLYGTPLGLTSSRSQYWRQDSSLAGSMDTGDNFGWAVTRGDFNGDGIDDAAIGVPGDLAGGTGAVNVLYGSCSGLSSTGNKRLTSGTTGDLEDVPTYGDRFGASLAAADFDRDGKSDLAVGSPDHAICGNCTSRLATTASGIEILPEYEAGAVTVFYGSGSGLDTSTSRHAQYWNQNSSGITGCASEDYDLFGWSLAAADFDQDGDGDLAIGVPGESIGDVEHAGMINVLKGSSSGLQDNGNQIWYQDDDPGGIEGTAETWDAFGNALAAGDFDGNGHYDLAIGVPYEDPNGSASSVHDDSYAAGAVNILYGRSGSTLGLDSDQNECWHRADTGIDGSLTNYARFGWSVASASTGP